VPSERVRACSVNIQKEGGTEGKGGCLTTEDERKLICQLLNKLYVPPTIEDLKLKTLLLLISNLPEACLSFHRSF
jgi:hypothetical protein